MTDPRRVALILRVIAGEIAEAKGTVIDGLADDETIDILDAAALKLRDLADTFEAVG